ncbi:MAG: hypothetical protein ACFFCO_05765 [Promethearchaeota archaeon]
MGFFLFEDMDFQEFITRLLVPLLVTLFFIQAFRTFVVNLYVAVWNIIWYDATIVPMAALAVLFVPLIGIGVGKKVSDRTLMISSGILAAVFTLPICLGGQVELLLGAAGFGLATTVELLFSTLVVACYSIFFPAYVASQITGESGQSKDNEAALFTASFSLAIAYDILIRSFNVMYDVSRMFLYIIPQTILVLVTLVLLVKELRVGESKRPRVVGVGGISASRLGGVLLPVGIGAILFLEIGFFANPQMILRWAIPSSSFYLVELILAIVFSIACLVVAALHLLRTNPVSYYDLSRWSYTLLFNLIVLGAVACVVFIGPFPTRVFFVLVHFFLILDLFLILQYMVRRQFKWVRFTVLSLAFFLSLVLLVLFCFMTGFAYAYAYLGSLGAIFEGQAPTLLLAAAVILLLTATVTAYKVGGDET